MKNFNLSLRKTYLFALMGTLILSSCSTDDTPSEDVSAIRQAEAANLNANAQVAAAQAALLNAQAEVEIAQAEQIKLENAFLAIENATAQAESELSIAEIQAQMIAAETARVNAQLALDQAMNTMQESVAEMQAEEVRTLLSKLTTEQNNLDQLMDERNAAVKKLSLAKFNLEFGVDYSNESDLISMQTSLETSQLALADLEANLILLKENGQGKQDVSEKLSMLQSDNSSLTQKIDSLQILMQESVKGYSDLFGQLSDLSDLKFNYENALNSIEGYQANIESLNTTLEVYNSDLIQQQSDLELKNTQLAQAQARLDAASAEYNARVEATTAAQAVIPGLQNAVKDAELNVNMAVAERNEYTGTDATVISDLDLAVTDAGTVLTDAQTALSDAFTALGDAQNLENNYYNSVVQPEEMTISTLESQIDNHLNVIDNLQTFIRDGELDMVRLSSDLENGQNFVAEHKETYDQIVSEYEALYSKVQPLMSAMNSINDQVNTLSNLKSSNQSLITFYNSVDSSNDYHNSMVKHQEELIAKSKLDIEDLQSHIKSIENNIVINVEDLQQEIDSLTNEIASIDVRIEGQAGIVSHYEDLLSQALAE